MPKYSSPDDIFREVVDESDEHWLLGLLAFAVVEEQRIEWARHRLETTGRPPTPADAQAWYESQPPGVIARAKAEAETALKTYSKDAIEDFDEAYRREIAQGMVVAEIRKLNRWVPQLGINVLGERDRFDGLHRAPDHRRPARHERAFRERHCATAAASNGDSK